MDTAAVATAPAAGEKTHRIAEIDYVKAICTLGMIFVHCFEEIYDGEGSATSSLFLDIFNVIVGASAFMFLMGFTLNLKKESSAKECLNRGIRLSLVALLFKSPAQRSPDHHPVLRGGRRYHMQKSIRCDQQ